MDVIDMLPLSPYLNHRLDAALRMMVLPAVQQGYAGIARLPGRLHAERCPEADEMGLAAFYDQFVAKAAGKLIKIWSGTCGETRFSTLSRRFEVTELSRQDRWQVFNADSGQLVGYGFSEFEKGERFRRSMETQLLETAPCLFVSPELRDVLRGNGPPCLGAIGNRCKTQQKSSVISAVAIAQ